MMEVRDHSQPCDHTLLYDGAYFDEEGEYWQCYHDLCPGGKRIVLRRSETFMARQELGPTAEVWIEVSDDE